MMLMNQMGAGGHRLGANERRAARTQARRRAGRKQPAAKPRAPRQRPGDWLRDILTGPSASTVPRMSTASHRIITLGKIATIRKLPGKRNRRVFDLSETSDCADCISCQERSGQKWVGPLLRKRWNQRTGWVQSELGSLGMCLRKSNPICLSGRLFGQCRIAGRMCCMDRARNDYRRAGWLAVLALCCRLRLPDR